MDCPPPAPPITGVLRVLGTTSSVPLESGSKLLPLFVADVRNIDDVIGPCRPRKPSVEDLQAMAETKVATDAAAAEEATAAADVAEPAGGEDLGPEPDLLQDADGGGGDEGDGGGGGDGDDAEADDDDEDGDAIAGLEVEAGEDSVLQRGWMNKRGQCQLFPTFTSFFG